VPARPIQQPNPELGFELLEDLADATMGDLQPLSRLAEVRELAEGQEHLYFAQLDVLPRRPEMQTAAVRTSTVDLTAELDLGIVAIVKAHVCPRQCEQLGGTPERACLPSEPCSFLIAVGTILRVRVTETPIGDALAQ
jgi:hypothetical protein